MESSKKLRKGCSLSNLIAAVCLVVSFMCFFILLISMLWLPEISWEHRKVRSYSALLKEESLDELGEMMVGILPSDLPFTVFIPSKKAFKRELRLWANGSNLVEPNENANTYAIISRLLGLAAVPQCLLSFNIPLGKEVMLESISGFRLHVSRESDGVVIVNRVRSELVNLRRKEIVVHVINGVIMDADFEQSVQTDYEDSN